MFVLSCNTGCAYTAVCKSLCLFFHLSWIMHLVEDKNICNPQSFCLPAAFCAYPKRPLTRLPFDIWWQRWDGRSTVGGCVRNACVCEVQGCSSRRGRQCDDVPSLHMIPSSMALWRSGQSAGLVLCRPRSKSGAHYV